jgi:acyl-CoA synthetase (AMP-forming)/AMP-acid ligase II
LKELVYHRLLLPGVERHGDRTTIIDGAYQSTLAQHLDRTTRLASALRTELGISRGDRFAVMAANSHEYLELYHAAFLGAGIVNPLNLRLAPAELEFILQDSGTTTCFVDALFADKVDAIRAKAGIERVVLSSGRGRTPSPTTSPTTTCCRPARRRSPRSQRRTTPSCSCAPAGRPGCPRACCSTSGPRC